MSYLIVRSIDVNPFDKISVISTASKVLLVMLIITILAILITTHRSGIMKYRDYILELYGTTIISLYSFSLLLPLRGTKYTYGYDVTGNGDINKIIEIASRVDVSGTYPPLHPTSLLIMGYLLNSNVQSVSKIHMILFTLVSLMLSFYFWRILFGNLPAVILILIQMAYFTDIGSPHKSLSMWLTYQSLIGIYISIKKQPNENKKIFILANVGLLISILSYPAYLLWSFPAILVVYAYLFILIMKKKVLNKNILGFGILIYALSVPYLINLNFPSELKNLFLLKYKIGDDYIYEGVLKNPFYLPPIFLLILILALITFGNRYLKNMDLYVIILILISNVYSIRLLNASQMSLANSVELWPRLDKPIFYLFVILLTLIFLEIIENMAIKISNNTNQLIQDKYVFSAITIFFIFVIFAGNFSEILIGLFPVEGNMAWFSHQSSIVK